jgi:hypothetical protein
MNGSPKPVIQYRLDETYCLGNNSKTGHLKEWFSEPGLAQFIHKYSANHHLL